MVLWTALVLAFISSMVDEGCTNFIFAEIGAILVTI